ncbi:MAG: J domain-containing protein [Synergistaceae bacterium]|jgi:curved DNA-binding protein CbpA|nr:J domain-containing protein [Synergistaceae bacterium]
MDYKTACQVLGVSPNASLDDVKSAYRLVIKLLHPDNFETNSVQWEQANRMIESANLAYGVITVYRKREEQQRKAQNIKQNENTKADYNNILSSDRDVSKDFIGFVGLYFVIWVVSVIILALLR